MIYTYLYSYTYLYYEFPLVWLIRAMVYSWVYHIRNFVLRNFCHCPGLATQPICTSRVWSMLVTAWPWHVATSMWLTKSAAPMVTRKCWLYLHVKRIVMGCNLQCQTSGRICYVQKEQKYSQPKQFCMSNYQWGKSTLPSSLWFVTFGVTARSRWFESKTSSTPCIIIIICAMLSGILTSCHITEEMLEVLLTNMNPCNTGLVEVFRQTSQARFCQGMVAWHSQINWLVKTSLKEQMDVEQDSSREASLAWPLQGVLVPLPIKGAKVGSPSWLAGKITSYVANLVGLNEVVDLRKFDA